jgi:hypothetical protein
LSAILVSLTLSQAAIGDSRAMLGKRCKIEGQTSIENSIKIACLPKNRVLKWQKAEWQDVKLVVRVRNIKFESATSLNVSAAHSGCFSAVEGETDTARRSQFSITSINYGDERTLASKAIPNPMISITSGVQFGGSIDKTNTKSLKCVWNDQVRLVGLNKNDSYSVFFSGLTRTLTYAELEKQKWKILISIRAR